MSELIRPPVHVGQDDDILPDFPIGSTSDPATISGGTETVKVPLDVNAQYLYPPEVVSVPPLIVAGSDVLPMG